MLHPNQFQVNEAWLAFKLNDEPVRTQADGDFNLIALMDAASCFILSTAFVPAKDAEPSKVKVRELLKKGKSHKQELPKTLFVPSGQFESILPAEAQLQGIDVVRVTEDQLILFIADARKGFREQFS